MKSEIDLHLPTLKSGLGAPITLPSKTKKIEMLEHKPSVQKLFDSKKGNKG